MAGTTLSESYLRAVDPQYQEVRGQAPQLRCLCDGADRTNVQGFGARISSFQQPGEVGVPRPARMVSLGEQFIRSPEKEMASRGASGVDSDWAHPARPQLCGERDIVAHAPVRSVPVPVPFPCEVAWHENGSTGQSVAPRIQQ